MGCVKSAQEGSPGGHKAWENRARPGSSLSQIFGSSSTNCLRPEERGVGSSTVVALQVRQWVRNQGAHEVPQLNRGALRE